MDITNEQARLDVYPHTSVIPQMVVTSADDVSEEPASNGHSTDASAEWTDAAPPVSLEKPDIDFEDISVAVRDVVSKCTETVSHSVRQRPLVIEEKTDSDRDESGTQCPPPPPPPLPSSVTPPPPPPSSVTPPPPTTMQRPLVFDGGAKMEDSCVALQKENESSKIDDEVICFRQESVPPPADECPTPTKKEGLHGVKKFFDSLLHHEPQETASQNRWSFEISDSEKEKPSAKKSRCESPPQPDPSKESSTFAKEAKQSIKSFFDTFKHESGEQGDSGECIQSDPSLATVHETSAKSHPLATPDSDSKHSTSFAKDTKKNIKTFFDNLKQDPCEQKLKREEDKKSVLQPNIAQEGSKYAESSHPESLKESTSFAKDTKQNIKAFFDTFKHEASEPKLKSKKSEFQPEIDEQEGSKNVHSSPLESPKTSQSFAKDTKQNIKAFFDTFKHESGEQKSKESAIKASASQPIIICSQESNLQSISAESPRESSSFVRDTKQNIKTFFDSLKLEHSAKQKDVCKKSHSQPDFTKESSLPETAKIPKDKEGKKKSFFDTFKSEVSSSKPESVHINTSGEANLIVSSIETTQPHESTAESTSFAKDAKHNIKTFFDSFKHEGVEAAKGKGILANKEALSETDTLKDSDAQHKDGSNPIRKLFSLKHSGDAKSPKESSKEARKDKQPKISKSVTLDLNPQYSPNGDENHAELDNSFFIDEHNKEAVSETKLQVQPEESKKKINLISSLKKTEVVSSGSLDSPEGKAGEHKGFKKFLDSFKHDKSEVLRGESQTDDDSVFPSKDIHAMDLAVESTTSKTSDKPTKEKKGKSIQRSLSDRVNREEVVQNFKGFFTNLQRSHKEDPQLSHKSTKKSSKDSEHIYDVVEMKSDKDINVPRVQIVRDEKSKTHIKNEAPGVKKSPPSRPGAENRDNRGSEGPKHEKSSMLNAMGENILALKDKVMHHTKEKRKSELIEASPKAAEDQKAWDQPSKEMSGKPTEKEVKIMEEPASLYNTCCIKLAVLLRDKAMDIVADRTQSPPPKPPKPSAEAIARARAASVSKRLEAQKTGRSIGENIPVGCDGIRFADDETESSCDYKDVENFDYIMDYELINRYKLDSNKFDTFSTDTGMSSYYTADTLTDIYSDAVMETVSLSSDISYSIKHLPSASRSEPKISTHSQEGKKGKVISKQISSSKSPASKKVPPPIPPKPAIIQNISKIKGKPEDKTVSQCVNGLSLSPRLQNKHTKDAAQKRPLMVADIKGTQFSSLQHSKPKKVPPKPARNFKTVLKNESLKSISCVTPARSEDRKEMQSDVKVEKRTLSPPRPPPPMIAKKPDKLCRPPDRPPPPASKKEMEQKPEKLKNAESEMESTDLYCELASDAESSLLERFPELSEVNQLENTPCESLYVTNKVSEDSGETNLDALNSIDAKKAIDDSLNNNILISDSSSEVPKRPPRQCRIRSRTVEIVPVERAEESLKRSSSLSDIDVQKRVTFLSAEKSQDNAKSLYTKINKDGKRANAEKISQSSPDLVSSRPLPAPPPPPRRFRSLERKGKSKKESENINTENSITPKKEVEPSAISPEENIKPPSRRRKTDKQRFFSLHSEKRKNIDDYLKRSMSVPLKPSRKAKVLSAEKYDVNANISNVSLTEENFSNIPKSGSSDSLTKSKSKDSTSPRKRSLSNWYDECDILNESWEIVDTVPPCDAVDSTKHNPLVPLRRKLEGKRKSRETSKFYVNMDEEPTADKGVSPLPGVGESASPVPPACQGSSPLPLVDKETSPLPLDCSEKSVQTSLETLSQGIRSLEDDRESEDTDELLDLAQTLQKELSTIINRHKSVTESNEDTPSPPLSAAASERNLAEGLRDSKKVSSVRSSTSEVWPVTSSDESDVERVGEDSSNVNEVALRRKQKKIFYIAREIMTSEEAFVDSLKLLNVDFKAAVDSATQQKGVSIIPDDVLCQILNHLPQLQHLNENLLMELKDRIENWEKMQKIADIIVKMGPFLKLYSWYIHDFESNVSLLEDSKKKYPAFAQVVKEFEMSVRCKRLSLNHYMLKPIQRIPQYRLLLQEYLHHMTEDAHDYHDTLAALHIVSEVANHANNTMKQGDNAQKLISIQNSIMGHKEIVKPGRVFVKEGELMKLSRKGMQPRWFVLFNDLLLYLTSVQQGLYRVNHELPLTGMKVAIPIQQDYQNEFSIISVTRSFTLAARSPEERQEWIVALTKAIEENASKRSTFTHSRLHQKAQDKTSSEEEGAFVLGKKAPVWIPDSRVTMCQLCTSEFTVTFRRHHCRACGKVVCSICSSHRISLPYLGNRIARVCDECHIHLGQGSCTESGETDSDNQQIAIKPHLRTDNRHIKKNKRMLPSVLKEVCANDQGSTISGYLHRKTGKSWKRDWFVVKDKVLYEYKASEDVAALRSTPLLGYQIESFSEALEGVDASLLFQLTHPGQAPIVFYADTVGSAERWVSALKTATVLE